MITVETTAERSNGVTTVRILLTNAHSTPQVVRLEDRVDGPVWLPRRDGVVDPCWTDGVWEATIRPGRSRGIGFASPVSPSDPLVEIVSSDRHDGGDAVRSPAAVLSDLEDWRPPSTVLEGEP